MLQKKSSRVSQAYEWWDNNDAEDMKKNFCDLGRKLATFKKLQFISKANNERIKLYIFDGNLKFVFGSVIMLCCWQLIILYRELRKSMSRAGIHCEISFKLRGKETTILRHASSGNHQILSLSFVDSELFIIILLFQIYDFCKTIRY